MNDFSIKLNAYRIMWIFVHFDLPTETKKDRKSYTDFRKALIVDGFTMLQFSIYIRPCTSRENAEVHKRRIKRNIPERGNIIIFMVTDKQFGDMEFFYGIVKKEAPGTPRQLELF